MKKFLVTIASALLACICLAAVLTGCDNGNNSNNNSSNNSNSGAGSSSSAVSALKTEKRYYSADYNSSDDPRTIYFLFHADGTGEYTYHYDYYYNDEDHPSNNDVHRHYTVSFKYTYADAECSSVVCFYDKVTYFEGNMEESVRRNWSKLLTVSENVLIEAGTYPVYYINEDFIGTIPNFNS